ncbi:type I restriction enzyme, S subunit [Salinimicrobium catena]|uniref:Type I restriction enzyme, S subunit n=1 Tax=Salinimicrobium catena TaxID=390640 RepID=A0A1H5JRQ5_9FLAO|nr:restriction endonuclease subunit S [Salinimicrobium catena]SDL83359.1 type I restriction enzyme, S subunit [Salinimicrobium catena]SEE54328.1 type I restriction enzyme, S subunit [Salinimicrobium catena]
MLKGLEVKEKLFSESTNNKDFRIDSQFYTQEPFKNPTLDYIKIGEAIKKAQYGISISMNEEGEGIPIYRMNEIHNMLCDSEVSKFAEITDKELSTFVLNDKDVVFNRTNSYEWVGRTGIYRKKDDRDFVFASYLVRFVPDKSLLYPEYLAAFLSSNYGIKDIKRRARQSINQTNVNPEEVKEIEIPLIPIALQKKFEYLFETAYQKLSAAERINQKASLLLEKNLNTLSKEISTDNINIKSYTESFSISGRFDAEYYQPKYDDYLEIVHNYSNGWKPLYELVNLKDKSFNPKKKEVYNYIELSNIGVDGTIEDVTVTSGQELPSRARRIVKKDDVIISSIEGSLQSCALITSKYHNSLCSTGFYVINSSLINSETLLILFKSEVIQNILKQNCSGTILTAINKPEFLNIPIPLIDPEIQSEISSSLKESFELKEKGEELLVFARQIVDRIIERGVNDAMDYASVKMLERDLI